MLLEKFLKLSLGDPFNTIPEASSSSSSPVFGRKTTIGSIEKSNENIENVSALTKFLKFLETLNDCRIPDLHNDTRVLGGNKRLFRSEPDTNTQ
ncbi:hypothetical protein E2C01_094694 [Portunus trituberculatus]|uniref:Uncharacterized protein n=1 Tax=Portunus trituberculatus TaxID=210409 RepID=A0A5B7JWT9_PORTR|nr:hypothetical protein [Portunus trituberculatus]